MFYAHIVLAKKGPLARIWLAAHWDKKLTKAHVFETNIEQSVEGIMKPKVKLALRTSGHLLLGVVRIYSRKAKYLLADCNEAFVKIKMAFRPGIVDLPEGHREAAVNAITLPEVFHDFDTAIAELNDVDIEAQFSINQSRADEITMREDYGSLSMSIHDDGFGDMGGFEAEAVEIIREAIDPNIDEALFSGDLGKDMDKEPIAGTSRDLLGDDLNDTHLDGDGFGDDFQAVGLFEGDIFGEPAPPPEIPQPLSDNNDSDDDDMDHFDTGAPSPLASSMGSRPPTPLRPDDNNKFRGSSSALRLGEFGDEDGPGIGSVGPRIENLASQDDHDLGICNDENIADQSTLINNEEETFALAPVDTTAYKGVTKAKRKRKLIVDEIKNISGEEMKSQLAVTSDIVTTLDLAPPTKRLMYWKETGGVEKLFAIPSRDIPARCLFAIYQRHLVSRSTAVEDFSMLGPADVLAIDQVQENESPTAPLLGNRRGRKRKLPPLPEKEPLSDTTNLTQLSEIDQIREADANIRLSTMSVETPVAPEISMELGVVPANESLMPPPPTPVFDTLRSPGHYPLPDLGLDPMTPGLPNIPMTPGNLSHGMDLHDDFHHSGLTPADLHHGDMTPHHPGIENIDSIPNLPADQVSSILSAAEGGLGSGDNLDYADRFGNDLANDWNDYDFPQSVGAHQLGDEQMENETDEQFEERVLNKRAAQMFVAVRGKLQKKDTLVLSEMTIRNNRKQAAQKFYSLLVLKKFRALEIEQDGPYADIFVTKGPMFDNPKL